MAPLISPGRSHPVIYKKQQWQLSEQLIPHSSPRHTVLLLQGVLYHSVIYNIYKPLRLVNWPNQGARDVRVKVRQFFDNDFDSLVPYSIQP